MTINRSSTNYIKLLTISDCTMIIGYLRKYMKKVSKKLLVMSFKLKSISDYFCFAEVFSETIQIFLEHRPQLVDR